MISFCKGTTPCASSHRFLPGFSAASQSWRCWWACCALRSAFVSFGTGSGLAGSPALVCEYVSQTLFSALQEIASVRTSATFTQSSSQASGTALLLMPSRLVDDGRSFDRGMFGRISRRGSMDAPRVRTATHGYHVRCRRSAALWCELIVSKRPGLPRWATLDRMIHKSTAIPVCGPGFLPASPSQSSHLTFIIRTLWSIRDVECIHHLRYVLKASSDIL